MDLGGPLQLNELENIFQLEGLRSSDPHLGNQTNLSQPALPSPVPHPLPDLAPPTTLHPPLNATAAAQEPLTYVFCLILWLIFLKKITLCLLSCFCDLTNDIAFAYTHSTQVEVNLYHKPRGKGGVWQRVEHGDRIRVTKGKGKALKIEVKTEYEWTEPSVSIVDLSSEPPLAITDGVSVQSIKSTSEFEINIARLCKKLQLLIRLRLTNGYDLVSALACVCACVRVYAYVRACYLFFYVIYLHRY